MTGPQSLPFVLLLQLAAAADFSGKVVTVKDGDTIEVLHAGRAEMVRLECIDAPEKGQPLGSQAKRLASTLAFSKEVRVRVLGADRYGRTLGEVVLPDGTSLNKRLVQEGLAWNYVQYCKDPVFARLEAEARKSAVGLWRDKKPEPPWEYRKRKKDT